MEEPYVEGVATHDGPESCTGDREVDGEALTGVRASWVWSRENSAFWVPMSFSLQQATYGGSPREIRRNPARSETPRERGTFLRENREIPGSPAMRVAGRIGKALATSR